MEAPQPILTEADRWEIDMAVSQHSISATGAGVLFASEAATLSGIEAAHFYEVMANLYETVAAFQNSTRFGKEGIPGSQNAAGRALEDFSETIGLRLEALAERMKTAPLPGTQYERDYLARILIRHAATYADSLPEIVALAAGLTVPGRH